MTLTAEIDLAQIKARDAKIPAFVFEIGYESATAGYTECAQDRRALIAEVERLRKAQGTAGRLCTCYGFVERVMLEKLT